MKYSELDFKDGQIIWDHYKHTLEEEHFITRHLNQDLLHINYGPFILDLGWYEDRYGIVLVMSDESGWDPFFTLEVFEHEKLFESLQQVINEKDLYLKLKVFL
jgi:hypothetical protein